jgi:hypothetical protein
MKLEAGKWYKTRNGTKVRVDYVSERARQACGHDDAEQGLHLWWCDGCLVGARGEEVPGDIVAEWTEPPVVGSYKWAMALPVGTKIKWITWIDRNWYVQRTSDGWTCSHQRLTPPSIGELAGWLLYTEPKLRPWHHSEVPLGAWIRNTDHKDTVVLITGSGPLGIAIGQKGDFQPAELLSYFEHSTDGGKTWLQCGSKE